MEDASTLTFGDDFKEVLFLPNASASLLLARIAAQKFADGHPPE